MPRKDVVGMPPSDGIGGVREATWEVRERWDLREKTIDYHNTLSQLV
jgi:hypothetical protein